MPDVNQYSFSHKELTGLLIKQAGVHEGKWFLSMQFGFVGGNFGPSPAEISPGMMIAITSVGIQRADANSPPALIVDAAEINPKA